MTWLARPLQELRLGQPSGPQIHLVGFVQQLGGAKKVFFLQNRRLDHQSQGGLPFSYGLERPLQGASLPIGGVGLHPLLILPSDGRPVKDPHLQKGPSVEHLIRRPFRNQNLGQGLAHAAALRRAVVEEHHGIQPQMQFAHQVHDILRFIAPIDAPAREVITPQNHLRMVVDGSQGRRFIVLADDAKQHTRARQSF